MSMEKVNALTEDQRAAALDTARRRIAGKEPLPADYERSTFSKYPPELARLFRRIGYVVLIAAFIPSAVRMFIATHETTHYTVEALALLIAAAGVLLAESGQVAFTLWSSATEERSLRAALWLGALGCTAFALVGNAHVVNPFTQAYVIPYMEAFLPPVLVLIASHVLKTQALHAVEARYAAHEQYVQAQRAWAQAFEDAPAHPRWMHAAANALRDALRAANKRSPAVMRALTDEDWRALILRELAADAWYERTEAAHAVRAEESHPPPAAQRITHSGAGGGVRTGETDGAVRDNGHDAYTGTCPHCGKTFVRDTEKGARNALAAHIGRFCDARQPRRAANGTFTVEVE